MNSEEEKYMLRCIQLAQNGLCNTAPNPMVGAVIVCDGKIIGEGYHVRCGEAHAEVNAIRSVKDTSLLKRSTHLCQPGTVFALWQNSSLCRPHHREADSTHRHRVPGPFF